MRFDLAIDRAIRLCLAKVPVFQPVDGKTQERFQSRSHPWQSVKSVQQDPGKPIAVNGVSGLAWEGAGKDVDAGQGFQFPVEPIVNGRKSLRVQQSLPAN